MFSRSVVCLCMGLFLGCSSEATAPRPIEATAGAERESPRLMASSRVMLLSTQNAERRALPLGGAERLAARVFTEGREKGIELYVLNDDSGEERTVVRFDTELAHRNDVTAWSADDGFVYVEWQDHGGPQEIGSRIVYRIAPPPLVEVDAVATIDTRDYDVALLMFQPVARPERVMRMGSL